MNEHMSWNDYRVAMDDLPASDDFEARVCAAVSRAGASCAATSHEVASRVGELARKQTPRRQRLSRRWAAFGRAAVVATLALALVGTAYAAVSLDDLVSIAAGAGDVDEKMAAAFGEAFTEGNGIVVDETQRVGDFDFTLCGVAAGRKASFPMGVRGERTYAVLSIARVDGEPITDETLAQAEEAWLATAVEQEDGSFLRDGSIIDRSEGGFALDSPMLEDLAIAPVVAGDDDWSIGRQEWASGSYCADGVMYNLVDVTGLRHANDRAYLAVYRGWAQNPSDELFTQNPDGTVSFAEGVAGALFEIPEF